MALNMISLALSVYEKGLLDEIENLAYGELYSVRHREQELTFNLRISFKRKNFIQALRERKFIDRLTIHDCEPVAAEIRCNTESGRECLQKLKF